MQVLTPAGYISPRVLTDGDEVCAFDETGKPIINTVEHIDFVDYAEWCRWWSVENEVPAFTWYRVNGKYLLFREQSIWRNGTSVCHARDLTVGDTIYDDNDQPVTVSLIEEIEDKALVWYRFDISGDHSYIIDGLTVHNASRFWVGGTGTWDSSTTTHWAATTGGTAGQSAPGSADTVTFDGSSGGGTVTASLGGSGTFQSFTWGAFTGTIDFSVNNDSVTLSAGSSAFSGTGSGTRTMKMGNGTWSITSTTQVTIFNLATTTNLTFTAGSSTIDFTGTNQSIGTRSVAFGTVTYNNVKFSGGGLYQTSGSGQPTFNKLTLGGGAYFIMGAGLTYTVTTLESLATSSSPCGLRSDTYGTQAIISCASGTQNFPWSALREMSFTGGATFTATNSFDQGHNSGITITGPSSGGMKYTNDMGGNLG